MSYFGSFEPKNMFTVFFKTTGKVFIDYMEKGSTITAKYYIENSLNPVIERMSQLRKKSGSKNLKILHDNARPHVTKTVTEYLKKAGITIIRHPPYSPDLALSNFWLFDRIKQKLDDHQDVESQKSQITKILKNIPKEDYKKPSTSCSSECNFVLITRADTLNI
jgi:histone-lysine N-methyltransferase SETMAR